MKKITTKDIARELKKWLCDVDGRGRGPYSDSLFPTDDERDGDMIWREAVVESLSHKIIPTK